MAVLVPLAVLAAACDDDTHAGAPALSTSPPVTHSPAPSAAPTSTAPPPQPEQVVHDPASLLSDAYVRRTGQRLSVAVLWACNENVAECPRRFAIARSDDGFATVEYLPGGQGNVWTHLTAPRPKGAGAQSDCASAAGGLGVRDRRRNGAVDWTGDGGASWHRVGVDLTSLLPWPVASLRRGTLAVAAGGDGATLFPFERILRSRDAGRTWATFDVTRPGGLVPYSSGFAVAADGRLVALLDNWSDDRRGKPSARVHGLYASDGADWSTYRPLDSRFRPALTPAPRGWSPVVSLGASAAPDPVIWVTTWDKKLYVSTDDARSFREVRAR